MESQVISHVIRQFGRRYYVGYSQATPRLQDTEGLLENPFLLKRKVDHAIRYDDINNAIGNRKILQLTQPEIHV